MNDEDETPPYDPQPFEPVSSRRRWLAPLLLFAVPLASGLLISLLWMHFHPKAAAPLASDATVTLDPVHRALPAPMAGGTTNLPAASSLPSDVPPAGLEVPAASAPTGAEGSGTEVPQGTAEITPADPDASPEGPPAAADSDPQVIDRSQPEYPGDALRDRVQGSVGLRVTVDEKGNAVDVRVAQSSGSASLDLAARNAALGWHYKPGMRDGQPVAGSLEFDLDFKLNDQK